MSENQSDLSAILVIEDNPAQLTTLCAILKEEGFRPVACATKECEIVSYSKNMVIFQ